MILCSGSFDGLHAGHVAYLACAAALKREPSEHVLVSVAPDTYQPHGHPPRWSQGDRRDTVQAIRDVDVAVCDEQITPAELIRVRHPRLFVKGDDWVGRLPPDVIRACDEVKCPIVYIAIPWLPSHNSDKR